jgi:WD40 repeat protein
METPKKKQRQSDAFESIDKCIICLEHYKEEVESSSNQTEQRVAVTGQCGHFMCIKCYKDNEEISNLCPYCKNPLTEVRHMGESYYLREKVSEIVSIHEQQVVKAENIIRDSENLRKNPWKTFGDVEWKLKFETMIERDFLIESQKLTALDLQRYSWEDLCSVAVAFEDHSPLRNRKPVEFGVYLYPGYERVLINHSMMITGIKFNEGDENLILTTSMDGTVALLDRRVPENVLLTKRMVSEQFVRPLWSHKNENHFLAGSTTGTIAIFDKRFCSDSVISIQGLNFEMNEKSSIVGLYNYQSLGETEKFKGFNLSPEIVSVSQMGIDLLFEDSKSFYARRNVYTVDANYVANSAFDNATKTILTTTMFGKLNNPKEKENESYRHQLMQIPAWNYTMTKSVPRHQWFVRNLFNYTTSKMAAPYGERWFSRNEYPGLNKVTILHHPKSDDDPTILIGTCETTSEFTIDCFRNGSIYPLFMTDVFSKLKDCHSVTSFSESETSVLLVLKKQGFGLHYLRGIS